MSLDSILHRPIKFGSGKMFLLGLTISGIAASVVYRTIVPPVDNVGPYLENTTAISRDVNRDGIPDLIFKKGGSTVILYGQPDGTYKSFGALEQELHSRTSGRLSKDFADLREKYKPKD